MRVFFPLSDFGSFFDLEQDLPDELISASDLAVANGGDLGLLHTSLGGGGAAVSGGVGTSSQDAAAKHKQLSELLRSGAQPVAVHQQQGGSPAGASMGLMGNMKVSPGPQNMVPLGQQHLFPQQPNLVQQQQMAGMVGGMNRTMLVSQKGNGQQQPVGPTPQQQGMMGGQMMNGTPRMGYPNPGLGSNSNLLAETLQQQGVGGQGGVRAQQPGALNKVGKALKLQQFLLWFSPLFIHHIILFYVIYILWTNQNLYS